MSPSIFDKKPAQPAPVSPVPTVQALQESNTAIQQAIKEVVEETRKSVKAVVQDVQQTAKVEKEAKPAQAGEGSEPIRKEVRPHAFIIMPFGKKKGADGTPYDFNIIYKDLIKPALEMAGFEAFRADEETASGDILTDMFQELLLADLALCDMSIDNANAYYELGIRHAFRRRGVMHIQAGRAYMPFDVFNVRTLPYHITPEGVPDPDFLEKDKQAIARMARDTWASDQEMIHSPVFNLLTGLSEPDRKTLRTPLATGFWREYNEWKERVTIAQRQKRIGDILLLTEEISNPLIKEEAIDEAGKALADMGRRELALAQYRKGLEVNSRNLKFRREEAFLLNRLGRVDDAIVKIEGILEDAPNDSEAIAYLGRIYKEMWFDSWKQDEKNKRLEAAFKAYHWLVKAFETYVKGYQIDLDQYYPGVNALTLATILIHLADKFDDPQDPDPDIQKIRLVLPEMRGALTFALETKAEDEKADYWTLVSLAELRVLTAENPHTVTRAYRKAVTFSRRNLFFLQSSMDQLEILKSLNMRIEFVEAGMQVLRDEVSRIDRDDSNAEKGQSQKPARQVFLFTGYMVDTSRDREKNFAPEIEPQVREAINKALEKYGADPSDLAIIGGLSAGSEILFAECCVERGITVKVYLPLPEAAYIRDFVSPGGDSWVERFYKVRNHPLASQRYQEERLGSPKLGDDLYKRNNRWALYSSLVSGIDKVRLIALWDGKTSEATDRDVRLVKHMVELMRDTGGIVEQINPTKLVEFHVAEDKKEKNSDKPQN
jgi:tetratricopeptide (TPR) repeat protein